MRTDRLRAAAVADARNAAAFVPSLRPSGGAVLAFAARAAKALGENEGNVPDRFVRDAASLVDDADRRAIVQSFAAAEPEWYERLLRLVPSIEDELIASAIRGAIADRRPVSRMHLVALEHVEPLPRLPAARLGLVLPSGALWSIADAESFLDDVGLPGEWKRWIDEQQPALLAKVEEWHIDRVRLLCDALNRHLPIASLPRASKIAKRDTAVVLRDDDAATATAGALLVSHSVMVASTGFARHSVN